ncbi:tetratricopeptide repeat protein [Patiriisocius sp. Uisw_017]|jgi:tetratricopeptide (TPR) repeat protein|uniref:tetratricopeptide repeat protein n=1 Tax=Patiriisocius sp. Uisw_017 TaxID=3230968 RepID=UPI0039ED053E
MRFIVFIIFLFIGFSSTAQSEILAKNYFDRGEYEKAISIYEKLYKESPHKGTFLIALVESHQQLEDFPAAQKLLEEKINSTRIQPQYFVDIGYNYSLQNVDSTATKFYKKALAAIDNKPNYATVIAKRFEEYSLLDEAIVAYEKGMELNPQLNANLQLARIYGEQGKLEQMFSKYIDLIETRPNYTSIAQNNFSLYVIEDPDNEANVILRRTLLKKLQQEPNLLYNELLSWLFIQQKDYKKAFAQEKAIYKRTEEDLSGITELAVITISEKAYEDAEEIVKFIIEKSPTSDGKLYGYQFLMKIRLETVEPKEYAEVGDQFEKLLNTYGRGNETYLLQIDYNHFLAFKANEIEKATNNLKTLTNKNLNSYQESRVKMELADILVLDEKFNRALIYYSQIQKKVKSDVLAQEARFKVAQTSYFKGDFEWAKAQVDVLRKSASQLIANDALELSLMIHDNTLEDSLQTALKKFAKADFLALQNKNTAAIQALDEILINHKGEKIEDEALLKQGKLFEKTNQYTKAEENYLKLIELYKEDILGDDAYYHLAKLYENQLENEQKAKEYYEQIIFNFADSIYFIEARKRFRMLRGDEIE